MFLLICTSLIIIVKHLKYRYCMQFFEKDTLYSKILPCLVFTEFRSQYQSAKIIFCKVLSLLDSTSLYIGVIMCT